MITQLGQYGGLLFLALTLSNIAVTGCIVALGIHYNLRAARRMTNDIVRANMEAPERPFTVSFSPDLPGLHDARRADAWMRTSAHHEALFFRPTTQRWVPQNFAYGVGTAFVDGALVTFRVVPTCADDGLIAALQHVAETRTLNPDLLARLSEMDPNEVFSIVEALGLVRPFNQALEAVDTEPTPRAGRLITAFGVQRRAIDLG